MVEVNVPAKQMHFGRLKGELLAAGVPEFSWELKPIYAGQDRLIFRLPDGTDPSVAAGVIAGHVDERTPEQIAKERLVQSLAATDTNAQRIRAIAMALYRAHVEMRVAFNGLLDSLAGIGVPLPPKMRIRTWEQAEQDLIAEIQGAEAANLKPSMMSAGDIDPAWEGDRIDREREVRP